MKKLKMYLLILLVFSIFIPETHAFEINGATFPQPRGYINGATNKKLLYDVTNGINTFSYFLPNEELDYYIRLEAVDNANVSSGQLLLYVNVCLTPHPDQKLQVLDYIENTIGRVNDLEQIANNMNTTLGSCQTGDGRGYLHQGVWAMSYILQRNQDNGYSYLDTKIHFTGNGTIPYSQVFSFNNIYVAEYDEAVVQTMKQQQISEQTNLYLQQQINQQQQTNEKLDDLNENITNNDISGSQNTANGFFDNFTDNDYGLSSIITIPLSSIQKITSAICTPLRLPIPFVNKTIDLPCMYDIYNNVPLVLNIWQIVSFGLISYAIIVDIFGLVKKFKDPNDDKLEVMDL